PHTSRSLWSSPSVFLSITRRPPGSTLFPYTTLFRSRREHRRREPRHVQARKLDAIFEEQPRVGRERRGGPDGRETRACRDLLERSEEHTSELQSLAYLVCRLLLEKKKSKDFSDVHMI